ncbi:MAG: hypothetical protein LBU40_04290 [Methanobrevibacter sp.]|nr:hypothetical protein [Methanobrevibacter sp.]
MITKIEEIQEIKTHLEKNDITLTEWLFYNAHIRIQQIEYELEQIKKELKEKPGLKAIKDEIEEIEEHNNAKEIRHGLKEIKQELEIIRKKS